MIRLSEIRLPFTVAEAPEAPLRAAAAKLAPLGITLLIEPINNRDMPGYFLNWQQQAHDVLAEVGATQVVSLTGLSEVLDALRRAR